MAEDLGAQLKLQQEINRAIKERMGYLRQQSQLMSQQAQLAQQMCQAMDSCDFEGATDSTQELTEGLEQAADQADETADSMSALAEAAEEADGASGGLSGKMALLGAGAGFVRGFMGSLKMSFGILKGLFKIVTTVIGSLGKLAMTIIALPFKILTGMIKMSQKGGIDPLKVALEEVKEVMGSIADNEGKMLADTVGTMRQQASNMAGTGLSMSRVFGYGREGLAKFLDENRELAEKVGIAFGNLRGQFEKNSVALAMYRKGLGITADQQAEMMKVAKARGKSIIEEQNATASMAIQMGKAYNISSKVVGKAMAEMEADVSTFGAMSRKHLGATAAYAAKLGVEIKSLAGLFDKFDNFENAAKGAAEMSQAFGMNVDAMALLKAESPAQVADEIRKSFHAAGNSLEDMDRHQRKMLESQTGLKGADLEAFFSPENMGMDYDEFTKTAETAEDKQLTQLQIMRDIADQIKKIVKDGSHNFNSFFDAFAQGFTKGIERSAEFRRLMRNLQQSLWSIHNAGIQVGKAFVKYFPGVKDIFGGLADLFEPRRFRKLAKGLIKTFTDFFKDLSRDPEKAVGRFLDRLTNLFVGHLKGGGRGTKKIAKGLEAFFTAFVQIFSSMIPWVLKKVLQGLEILYEFILNPAAAMEKLKAVGQAGGSAASRIFAPLIKVLTDAGTGETASKIGDVFMKIMGVAWEKICPPLSKALGYVLMFMFAKAMIFGIVNALAGAFITAGIPAIAKGAAKMMKGAWKGAQGAKVANAAVQGGKLWGKANSLRVVNAAGKQLYGKAAQKALASGTAKAMGTGFKGGMKAFAVNMQGAGGRVAGKVMTSSVGKAITAPLKKVGSSAIVKGLGKGLSTGLKAIPVAGWVAALAIDAGFAFSDAWDTWEKTGKVEDTMKSFGGSMISGLTFGLVSKETGSKIFASMNSIGVGLMRGIDRLRETNDWGQAGAAMVGGFFDAVTFGLVDGDGFEDFLTGSNRMGERINEELEAQMKEINGKIMAGMKKMVDANKKVLDDSLKDFEEYNMGLRKMRHEIGNNMSESTKAMVDGLIAQEDAQKKQAKKTKEQIDILTKDSAKVQGMHAKFNKAIEGAQGTLYDSDAVMAFGSSKAEKAQRADLLRALQREFGSDAVKGDKNMITIDDDIYQKKGEKLQKILKEVTEKHSKKSLDAINKATMRGQMKMEQQLLGKSVEEYQKAQKELAAKGAPQEILDKFEEHIKKRVELDEMKKALLEAGVKADDLKGKSIQGAYEDYLKKMTDKDAMKELKVKVQSNIEKAQQKALAGALTEAEKQENKLSKLQAAKELADQIEKLKDIPQRLEKLQATMKKVDVKKTEATVKKLFAKVAKIADVIVRESNSKEMQKLVGIKTAGFTKITEITGLVSQSISNIQSVLTKAYHIPKEKVIQYRLGKATNAITEMVLFVQQADNAVMNMGTSAEKNVDTLSSVFADIDSALTLKHLQNPKFAANVVRSVQLMKGLLKPAAASVKEIQAFSGGDLHVTHNLPNTKIDVHVSLDATKVGKAVGRVNVGKNNAAGRRYYSVEETMSSDIGLP